MNSGVYFITGKLGGGKSLISVAQIQDRLRRGCPVATNLDIKLHHMFNRKAKKVRLTRLPDKPKASDLYALGSGNTTYDESKNGLIVLDECGTWFNARDWNDKDRKGLLEWLLYARKLGWDIIFLVQDISMIDKQARKSVSEHVGYCRRVDKMSIPVLDGLCKLVTGRPLPKPKMHVCVVRLGDLPHSPKVDTMSYMGTHLYSSYDTKQTFRDDYPNGLHTVLPPWYTHGRYQRPRDWRTIMRITKIYFRRFSKVAVLSGGIVAGAAIAAVMQPDPVVAEPEPVALLANSVTEVSEPEPEGVEPKKQPEEKPETLAEKFSGFVLNGVARNASGEVIYVSVTNGDDLWNIDTLRAAGYVPKMVNACELLIMTPDRSQSVRLHTGYCGPEKPSPTPPRMSPEERYAYKLKQLNAERAAVYGG